ncbi:MAG: LuxR C-terminal-related transcriptional regulator [Bacteroides sp.]|nr:LuxR C-terminal-related transcriptional regulator [Bacteroides sp.]MCM1379282.1 LuxR C-terminal-related transcriptional regulator [Bacteroides sp.]MCM1445060.1 LuxR C-terminal-related transcriptional regulator [Prevotella sp.]
MTQAGQYRSSDKMREVIADSPMLLMALSRFGIPLGFGEDTVGKVCERAGVDVGTFLAVASLIGRRVVAIDEVSLHALISYLKSAHSYFIEFYLPQIRRKLISAINYAGSEEVTLVILKFFDDYVAEVKRHMEFENTQVFGYVEELLNGHRRTGFSIEGDFVANHQPIATKLRELKDIFICHYHGPKTDNDLLNLVLFDIINCEQDLLSHCDVENRIFAPAVRRLERKLRPSEASAASAPAAPGRDPEVHNLTEREKDIIRNVARGLSNKEIADKLCLSPYTVATHRRNICAKLDIHSAAGLTIFAIIHHLLKVSEVKVV